MRKRGNDSSDNVEVPDNTIIGFVDSDSDTSKNLSTDPVIAAERERGSTLFLTS